LLVDIVSKNGNLLLDVGPEADGTIPAVQMDRLEALGAWLNVNGEGIYGTRPWKRAEGETTDGMKVRFTQKDGAVYAFILGEPKGSVVEIKGITLKEGAKLSLLGSSEAMGWKQMSDKLVLKLPKELPAKYAVGVKMVGME
jgi:alpha-L-fucosidase